MIRVGFQFSMSVNGWLGGANYFRSLLGAIDAVPGRKLQPVLFVGTRYAEEWRDFFPDQEMVVTPLLEPWSPAWTMRKGIQALTARDFMLTALLARHGVRVVSHGIGFGPNSSVKSLGWVPDFQHVHLPSMFSAGERHQRDKSFHRLCRQCDVVLVSSEDARKDLVAFHPLAVNKVRVLRFVPQVPDPVSLPTRAELNARYHFHGPYFHVPNQFWAHKNHQVIVEALDLLRRSGKPAKVLATGTTQDNRNPNRFMGLMEQVRGLGLEENFRHLGLVPYRDMLGLMLHSEAMINPSLFEGWSTSVEEAKLLGVPCVLSDLPVHREQDPPGGRTFPPHDPAALAECLTAPPILLAKPTHEGFLHAYRAFGEDYQSLVINMLGESKEP
jgi:glycosyltransferase involved in cell wall biosynthesis